MYIYTMKELEKNNIRIEQVQEKKKEYKPLFSINKIVGLKLYACNTETFEIKEVKPVGKASIDLQGNIVKNSHANYEQKNVYIQALNRKNVERKFNKMIGEIKLLQQRHEQENNINISKESGV